MWDVTIDFSTQSFTISLKSKTRLYVSLKWHAMFVYDNANRIIEFSYKLLLTCDALS